MPKALATGNSKGPNNTMAGMPSNMLPRMMNASMDTIMKPMAPPGTCVMSATKSREKPDCVSAQAMAVAQPMMSKMAPDKDAVSTSIG